MNLQRLEYFVAVIDAGSLSRAAAILDMSQPALSRQIALLEEETGHRLLTRHGRGVEPLSLKIAEVSILRLSTVYRSLRPHSGT